MATNINQAGFAGVLDKTTAGLAEGMQNREQAQLEKQQATYNLNKVNQMNKDEVWKEEANAAKLAAEEVNRKMQKENMFRGLKYFTEDKNPRHLNALLKGGPMSKSGITRFSKIDPNADKALIMSSGMDTEDLGESAIGGEHYGDSARFVKGIMQDGSEKIFDVYQVKQMTGYFKSLNDQQVAQELALNEGKTETKPKTYGPGALEKDARFGASQGMGGGDLSKATKQLWNDKIQGNVAGKLEEAELRTKELNTQFGGNFLANFEPTNSEHREMAYPSIAAIEKLEGVEFDSASRKEMRDVGVLLALGEPGRQLNRQETGILDSLVTDVKKYVTDTGGSEAVSAYAAFRNSLRHALYGSALTDSEIKSFNEQFGTRRQQLAPLLKQMKTAMMQIQGKMSSIADMQNPYSAKYRIGASQERADEIVSALQQRITYLGDLASGKSTEISPEGQADKDQRIIGEVWK